MNSNLKLLPAALFVAVLALAGCGGGSSDETTTPPPPPPTPEEECLAGDGVVYEDGVCKTAEDLRQEGRDAEKEAEEAKAMEAMAKKLRGLLAVAAVDATNAAPTNTGTTSADLEAALTAARAADNGEGREKQAHVMVYDTKGPGIKVDAPGTAFAVGTNAVIDRNVMGADFATSTTKIKSHANNSVVRGSYYGATGGYTCGGTDCTSQRTKDGIRLAGTWTWAADSGQKYDAADASYAEYGWWLDEGIAVGDPANDRVGAWYLVTEGGTAVNLTDTDTVTGTATYNGQAVGKAAYYHSQSGSNIGGAFTADATLNADFDANMLSGSITGFDVGGMNPDWSVELMKYAIAGTGIATTETEDRTKWTINGIAGDAGGSWSAHFYDTPTGEHQPSGVAGGFQAQYESDGYMVGAFGAER